MIRINKLTFSYENAEAPALKNINLNIGKGEFVGIAGPAGAGKSTLALCINGVIPHFQSGDYYGEVLVDGNDTVDSCCASLACSVGSVFQDPEAQLVSANVEEEIAFGLENMNLPRNVIKARIEESLELTGISDLKYSPAAQLSGGQKQRVIIASAIALQPKILLLDEPTSELDPKGSRDIFDTLKMLNTKYGITIVIIEQKMQLLSEYCSRLVIMDKGSIALDGATREVLSHGELLKKLGVNCSPIAQLTYMLKDNGLYNGEIPVNVDEAFMIVSRLIRDGA